MWRQKSRLSSHFEDKHDILLNYTFSDIGEKPIIHLIGFPVVPFNIKKLKTSQHSESISLLSIQFDMN